MKDINHGFKITVNNKTICRAGFENENSVLTCILTSSLLKNQQRNDLDFYVNGLNSDTKQHAQWFKSNLKKGDKIELEIITDDFEPPKTYKKQLTKEDVIQKKLKTYHKLKEELQEYL